MSMDYDSQDYEIQPISSVFALINQSSSAYVSVHNALSGDGSGCANAGTDGKEAFGYGGGGVSGVRS